MYQGFESKFDESFAKWKAPEAKKKNPFRTMDEGELMNRLRHLTENLPKVRTAATRDPDNENFRLAIQNAEEEKEQILEVFNERRQKVA